MLPISAMVYFINDPDSQRSGRRAWHGRTDLLESWGRTLFTKYVPSTKQILKKKSHPIRPVECLELILNFLFYKGIT